MNWLRDRLYGSRPFAELAGMLSKGAPPYPPVSRGESADIASEGATQDEAGRSEHTRVLVKHVPGSLPTVIADFLHRRCARPVLFVAETLEDAEEVLDDLTALAEDKPQTEIPASRGGMDGTGNRGESALPCLLPGRPHFERELTPVEQSERAEVLLTLARHRQPLIVATAAALIDPLPKPGEIEKRTYIVAKGETLTRESLLQYLVESGYKRELFVEAVGQFAVRGAVVDIYAFGSADPVRVEFFDDLVESVRTFDPSTQKSSGEIPEAYLMAGVQPAQDHSHLLEHLPADTVIIWGTGRASWQAVRKAHEEALGERGSAKIRALTERMLDTELEEILGEDEDEIPNPKSEIPEETTADLEIAHWDAETPPLVSPQGGGSADDPSPASWRNGRGEIVHVIDVDQIRKAARGFAQLFYETSPGDYDPVVDFRGTPQERFAANLPLVADRLRDYYAQGTQAVILADSQLAGDRLAQVLIERGCPEQAFVIREGGLHHGFTLPDAKLAVLVDHDIFGRMRRRRRFMKFKNVVPLHDIDALKAGDFVVHVDYGIGRYVGLTKINVNATQREVLKILYKDDVTLFVKLENLAQVQKYSGREGFHPPLSKIGGREWKELKKKTKKSLLSIAEDLIKLYATRKQARGYAFSTDTLWQREMEASFPYEDTPDQLNAAEEVKRDMERNMPMDRLVVGDVGYGKTEVAMRGAFKAVTDGKQVAVLVPTTILAMQHYRTFRERFKNWPVKVEVMSRFQGPKDQRMTLKKLEEGQVDVVIGTHRMLSKDVVFNNLGLLVIDEEHRFGVVQKERIKSLRTTIDVLSMSATPIPRTLHMALMGARDLSQINTPPPGRLPIETDVVEFSEKVIKEAIEYELQRGGQVFFVHNRIQTIPTVKRMLERLLPGVRFGIGHGQMDEDELARVMMDFVEGTVQVLISTMIIESGIDMPNVNTMIVNRADRFGVAQLHQLRGRIGRSSRKAYAYLLVPPKFEMTTVARERLAALTNFSNLGAGFQLAMRDLEIRGAGNLLGREQSGYINAVGFEMYQRLIEEAVREVQLAELGQDAEEREPVELKLRLDADAFFPEPYMPEGSLRLNYYRELSKAKKLERVEEVAEDVRDRFGKLPEAAENLFDMVRVRVIGEKLGAERIEILVPEMVIEFPKGQMTRERLLEIAAKSADFPVEFSASGPVKIKLPLGQVKAGWKGKMDYAVKFLASISEEKAEVPA